MGVVQKILRYITYFRRGHSLYGSYLIQLANFMMLVSIYLHTVIGVESSLTLMLIIPMYVAVATVAGWLDFRKGQHVVESVIAARNNPVTVKTIELSLRTSKVVAELARRMNMHETYVEIMRKRNELARLIGVKEE